VDQAALASEQNRDTRKPNPEAGVWTEKQHGVEIWCEKTQNLDWRHWRLKRFKQQETKLKISAAKTNYIKELVPRPSNTGSRRLNITRQDAEYIFLLKFNKFTTDPRGSPSSLPHLIIEMKIYSWHATLNLGMQMTIREVARSPILLGSYL
jgi:hypothetical protein